MTACPHPLCRVRRRGFTLVEVLLTLCVLVMLAVLCFPVLTKGFRNQRLRAAADRVRTQWVRARVEAMRNDATFIFRYTPGGNQYHVECRATPEGTPDQPLGDNTDLSSGASGGAVTSNAMRPIDGTLPDGITFLASATASDVRSAMVDTSVTSGAPPTTGGNWSEPVLFYADGTTSTTRLQLRSDQGKAIELSLRGMTGVVTMGDIFAAQEGWP